MQVPLRDKHLPLLLFPLSILAGLGFAWILELLKRLWHNWRLLGLVGDVILIIVAVFYFWQIGQTFYQYQNYQQYFLSDKNQILADYITKFTAPTDCIITDSPTLAFVVNRQTPPYLAEASSARLRSGYLTTEMLVDIAGRSDCQIVAPIDRRFNRSAPQFVEWSKQNYQAVWLYDGSTEVMLAKPVTHAQPQYPLNVDFDNQVTLVGYDLSPVVDNHVYLSLYWKSMMPFADNYTIFVQVRDDAQNTLINADHQPYDGKVPTSIWREGEIIKETIRLDVTPEMPVGTYEIYTGMYLIDNGEFIRLPLIADTSGENAVIIPGMVVN